ncbi:extracellular catalytic domain type 1 short-chain-length polyhydroxyalkanoate depolymerase [Massilia cavernae]|uniref:PHB depolymerase esterase n=1 Tax=Massilia cavernae TaxID=2320864 RepID=A0A418Y138_9BURK|nr:PHB depolymerase family esterase [Massilia cavernae]RJG19094.1 PHB depolymerase esterase [Massilia cavernae]
MVRKASPWLRSLLRAAKIQQRTSARAVKTLLALSKPAAPKKTRVRKAPAKTSVLLAPRVGPAAGMTPSSLAKPSRLRATRPTPHLDPPGRWLSSHFTAPGKHGVLRSMLYWVYVPSLPPQPQGMPLVVMLHGCDQNAISFAQGTRMNELAERKGFAVVYPQQSVASHPHACWKWYDRATQLGGGDVGHIVGIVNSVAATHPIDRSRIYICGLSAGGAMAHIVALNHPGLIAGVGIHSSPLFGAARGAVGAIKVMRHGDAARAGMAIAELFARQPDFPGMPTILIHGEADGVVRPINQSQLELQSLQLNRVPDGTPVEISVKARTTRSNAYQLRDIRLKRNVLLRVVRIAELKHAWSGGNDGIAFNSGFGPDSSQILIDFFARHRRGDAAAIPG